MALVDRAQAIILRPRQEWQVIDAERTTTADLERALAYTAVVTVVAIVITVVIAAIAGALTGILVS